MKKLILFLMVLLTATGCKKALKDVNDYFPKVSTVSAVVQSDGSLLVTGSIISQGAAEVKHCGVSLSTSNNPALNDRQLVATVGNSFSCSYTGLSVDSVYYVRAWAANRNGYALGNVLSMDSIIASPVTAPCSLTSGTYNFGIGTGTSSLSTSNPITAGTSSGTYVFSATMGSSYHINYTFGSPVTTGIYTTSTSATPAAGQVNIEIEDFTPFTVIAGSSVYVNRISPGVYDVTTCAVAATNGSTNYYLSSRTTAHD